MVGTAERMAGSVSQSVLDDMLVLTLAPTGGAGGTVVLTADVRAALMAAIAGRGAARAIVLRGTDRGFATGTSLDDGMQGAPSLADLCDAVEGCSCPVVAVLQGAVIGAGAELALAAHGRVASEDARFSLPEAGLGLLPQAGASQRLPRLVGAGDALRLLTTGRAITATEALVIGLLDHVVEGDALTAGLRLAASMPAPVPVSARRDGLRDAAGYMKAVGQARAGGRGSPLPVVAALADCVEAALLLPFPMGVALEAALQADLAAEAPAAGLRAAALAERRVASLPAALAAAQPRLVGHMGIAGVGAGGSAAVVLALVALSRGLAVTWAEPDRALRAQALQALALRQEAEVTAGRLTPAARDADWARLSAAESLASLAQAGLIVVPAAGPTEGPAGAAEATLAAVARAAPGVPVVVVGGHAGAMGLTLPPSARVSELALPDGLAPVAGATAVQVLRRVGLPPVLVGKRPGLGVAVVMAGRWAVQALRRAGVTADQIARALTAFGLPETDPTLRDLRRAPPEDPAASRLTLSPDDIVQRWLAAQANAGLVQLADGVARRPSDIDHLLVAGHGFPRHQGGPMHLADARGLLVVRADLRRWATLDPIWQPAPLLDRLIAESRSLASLNGR